MPDYKELPDYAENLRIKRNLKLKNSKTIELDKILIQMASRVNDSLKNQNTDQQPQYF